MTGMNEVLQTMLEHAQSASEVPDNMGAFAVVLIVSILFGLMLQLLYSLYFHVNEPQDGSLARSLVLLTPALTATFWMIQSSLVMSLGLLGSLSFVRFRTPIKRSEDVSFIVIGLAVAIACASEHFIIAASLVALLFIYTFCRNHFERRSGTKSKFAIITFNTTSKATVSEISQALTDLKIRPEFISSRTYDGITSYVFNASKVSDSSHDQITSRLTGVDKEAHINVFYPNDRLGA